MTPETIAPTVGTQEDKVLGYMHRHQYITALYAMQEYNVMRLAARIGRLREMGHDIKTTYARADNGARYARYALGS